MSLPENNWEDSSPSFAPEKEVKVTIGPGLSSDPETLKKIVKLQQEFEANPKSVEVMKEFMSKTVEQLAADTGSYVETLHVRGMDVVIPKGGTSRSDTILFASLAALRHPDVDAIFRQLKLRAQVVEDGKVILKRLVPDIVEAEAKPIQGISEEKPVRNIVIGNLKYERGKDVLVAVVGPPKSVPWLGTVDPKADPSTEADGAPVTCVRPLFGGEELIVREDQLIPIRTEAQLADIFNGIASQK